MNSCSSGHDDRATSDRATPRREFLAKASQVAITAPAATLLLAASSRQSVAHPYGKHHTRGNGGVWSSAWEDG
jgi:hypothetical protein